MKKPLNILVLEDDPLIAEDIRGYLLEFGYRVAGPSGSCAEAKRIVIRERPDAAILDIDLGEVSEDGDGCQMAAWLNEHHPMPFIFLTSHSDAHILQEAQATRPGGYLLKPFSGAEIRVALLLALSNFTAQREDNARLLDENALQHALDDPLSEQELRILICVEQGLTNKQTGERLFISENTVKTHLKHIFEKLNVRNRTEAIHRARLLATR